MKTIFCVALSSPYSVKFSYFFSFCRTVVVGGNSDDNEFQIPRGYMYDWAVDDGSTWAVLPALPTGREEPACGAFTDPDSGSTYVLVTGGLARDTGRETDETVVLRMDDDGSGGLAPADQWEDGPELPIAVTGATIIEDQVSIRTLGNALSVTTVVLLLHRDPWCWWEETTTTGSSGSLDW